MLSENSCNETTAQEIKLQKSCLDIHLNCESLFQGKELKSCNLIDFFANCENGIQFGGIRTFFPCGIFLDLEVLGHFGLKIRQRF